jgi:membrane protease YdiL (CAAX protease family)
MTSNPRIASPWSQLALFLVAWGGAFILVMIFGGIILAAKVGLTELRGNTYFSDPRYIGTLKLIQALSTILLFGFPAFVYAWRTYRDRPLYYLGFRPSIKTNFYLLGILILFASMPFEGWLGQLNKGIPLPGWMLKSEADIDRQIGAMLKADSPLTAFINIIVIALLPAIFEEACFRGGLQRILIRLFKSPWSGIVLTAIIFSAIHGQFQGFLPRFFLGVLLGAVYWYSGSLWVSILAHFFLNGIQVIAIIYYPQFVNENPSVPGYTALISLVIVVGLLLLMIRQSSVTYEQEYPIVEKDPFDGFPT